MGTKASIFQQQQLQRHHQHQFNQRGGNRNTSSESRSVTPSAASNKSRSPSLRSFKSDTLRSELTQSSFRSQHLYENKRAQSAGAASQMAKRMVMDLGVQDSQEAEVAMNVIDRLS